MARVNETHCKAQIMRLSATSFFPSQIEGITELARTLQRSAHSDKHATRVIDAALEASSNCPTPHDIGQLCRQVREADDPALPNACRECAPYQGNWRLITTASGQEGIERCSCARGRALSSRDAERRAAKEKGRSAPGIESAQETLKRMANDPRMRAAGGDE